MSALNTILSQESVNAPHPTVLVVGNESVGKSALISSLTRRSAYSSNFRGSTVAVKTYPGERADFVDTPGILFQSDTATTQIALSELGQHERVLVVVKGTHLDQDVTELMPLVLGKRGAIAVTFWDKIEPSDRAMKFMTSFQQASGVPVIGVDARHITDSQRAEIHTALESNAEFVRPQVSIQAGWQIEPKPGLLQNRWFGTWVALLLLLVPSVLAVQAANGFAGWVEPLVNNSISGMSERIKSSFPVLIAALLIGKYGLITMGPLLLVWAVPTVFVYAVLLASYKSTGLLDQITTALHPLMRPIGLTGRDLVRVLMGMGCNVPAVIATRSCSSCTRSGCLHAIGFGSACSYQFGSTLAVFAAMKQPGLIWPFIGYLTVSTLIYVRLVSHPLARSKLNLLSIERRSFLCWPNFRAICREAGETIYEFATRSLPVFFSITLIASLLDEMGAVHRISMLLQPLMGLFRLPADTAVVLLMASIRKDGLLLLAEQDSALTMSRLQILTSVYLAGVLLPCLVTIWTIAREQSIPFAAKLVGRQLVAAVCFSLILSWGGHWLVKAFG